MSHTEGAPVVIVVGAYPESLVNFRGALIATLVARGCRVIAMAGPASPDVVARLAALGAAYRAYPVSRSGVNPVTDLRTLLALRHAFAEIRPDIVLAYTIKPVVWGGIAARLVGGIRFFALITGLGYGFAGAGAFGRSLRAIVAGLYRAALSRSAGVIFQNEDDRAALVAMRVAPADRTHRVWGSGVDCAAFASRPLPAGPATFLLVGRLVGFKGLREYAAAARLVKRDRPDAVFRIAGGPDPSPGRVDLAEVGQWVQEGTIEWLGELRDVRSALSECHVFVLPSYYEGVPRSVLEAMATGRPILTSDAPGCRDTVVLGENGFLVPPRDVGALAERLGWFIDNRGRWAGMGVASRRLAETRFEVGKVNEEMARILGVAPVT